MEDNQRRPTSGETTRSVIVKAAIAQLALEGLRGLTHRKVEQRAGVSQGSAKYHFGTLDALIEAVTEQLLAESLPIVPDPPPGLAGLALTHETAELLRPVFQQIITTLYARPDLLRARYEIYLHAAGKPALQQRLDEARAAFVDRAMTWLPGPNSRQAARYAVTFAEGLEIAYLTNPQNNTEQAADLLLAAAFSAHALAQQPTAQNSTERPS